MARFCSLLLVVMTCLTLIALAGPGTAKNANSLARKRYVRAVNNINARLLHHREQQQQPQQLHKFQAPKHRKPIKVKDIHVAAVKPILQKSEANQAAAHPEYEEADSAGYFA